MIGFSLVFLKRYIKINEIIYYKYFIMESAFKIITFVFIFEKIVLNLYFKRLN